MNLFNNNSRETLDIFDDILVDNIVQRILKRHIAVLFYIVIIVGVVVIILSKALLFFNVAMKSSRNLHAKMFGCLLQAPMKFFDKNPCGRILNRFSKDMGAIDEVLPKFLQDSVQVRIEVKYLNHNDVEYYYP